MRLFFVVLAGLVTSVTCINPPDSNALNDVCNGLGISTTIASKTVAIRDNSSPDPNIEPMRIDLINNLLEIGEKFRLGLKTGEAYSRSGVKVAKEFISALDQFIAGGLHVKDVPDIARDLTKRVTEQLTNAKDMHAYFGEVQTDVEKLEIKTNTLREHVNRAIAHAQEVIEDERFEREVGVMQGVFFGLAGLVFPPALAIAGERLLQSNEHHENVVYGLKAIEPLLSFSDDSNSVLSIVKQAHSATAGQIFYWSQMLDQLDSLQDYSTEWLENLSSEWKAKKLVAQWRTVEQKYSECAHTTSEAHRYLEAHMQ